jgi:hypothetical protein
MKRKNGLKAGRLQILLRNNSQQSTFSVLGAIAASSFIEGSCGSPYHGRVFLNSGRQMAPTKNLSRG